jgi:glycosyltransferase involved in cell wall biosynthesis
VSVPRLAGALAAQRVNVELFFEGQPEGPFETGVSYVACPSAFPMRLGRSPAMRRRLLESGAQLVHASGLWMCPLGYAAEAAARHRVPLVISPRGMLAPWSLRRSPWKKRLANGFIHPGALERASGWHVTSREEEEDVRRLGYGQPVCVAPNGVEAPSDSVQKTRECYEGLAAGIVGQRLLLFYSRFHAKKRVLELIADFAALGTKHQDWHLLIVGIPEQYSVAVLRAAVAAHGLDGRVSVLDGRGLPKPFGIADLFVLPSHNENFGQVVAEALAAGLPVVTTDGTPWGDLDRFSAGRRVPLVRLSEALDAMMSCSPREVDEAGRRGQEWVLRDLSWAAAASRLSDFYAELISQARQAA